MWKQSRKYAVSVNSPFPQVSNGISQLKKCAFSWFLPLIVRHQHTSSCHALATESWYRQPVSGRLRWLFGGGAGFKSALHWMGFCQKELYTKHFCSWTSISCILLHIDEGVSGQKIYPASRAFFLPSIFYPWIWQKICLWTLLARRRTFWELRGRKYVVETDFLSAHV